MSVCSKHCLCDKGLKRSKDNRMASFSTLLIPQRRLIHPSCSRVTGQWWTLSQCLRGQRCLRYLVLIVDGNESGQCVCLSVVLTIFIIMLFIKCSTGSSTSLCVLLQNVPVRVVPCCRRIPVGFYCYSRWPVGKLLCQVLHRGTGKPSRNSKFQLQKMKCSLWPTFFLKNHFLN